MQHFVSPRRNNRDVSITLLVWVKLHAVFDGALGFSAYVARDSQTDTLSEHINRIGSENKGLDVRIEQVYLRGKIS